MTGPRITQLPTGICEICGEAGIVHRDHSHGTGAIRGVLCVSCNHGLARFKDDPELVQAALDWLLRATRSETYIVWMRERRALAQRRYEAVRKASRRRRERAREHYAEDPEYRARKLADNKDYRERAGI